MMSTKKKAKGGGVNKLKPGVADRLESPNLSSIERDVRVPQQADEAAGTDATFIVERNFTGCPLLHSTAIGDDLHTGQESDREERERGGRGEKKKRIEGETAGGKKRKIEGETRGGKKGRMEGETEGVRTGTPNIQKTRPVMHGVSQRKERETEGGKKGRMERETEGVRTGTPHVQKTRPVIRGVAQRKERETDEEKEREKEKEKKKKQKQSVGGEAKGRPLKERLKKRKSTIKESGESEREGPDPGPAQKTHQPTASSEELTDDDAKLPAGKMAAQKREERLTKSGIEGVDREESDSGPSQLRNRPILSSEDITDEDTSWKPSPKKARKSKGGLSLDLIRKSSSVRSKTRKSSSSSGPRTKKSASNKLKLRKTSSDRSKLRKSAGEGRSQKRQTSDSGSTEAESTNRKQKKKNGHGRKGSKSQSELEVVLNAFLDFCDRYRESVELKVVRKAIASLSSSVEEQLQQKITAAKELKVLRRENTRVASKIQNTRQGLLEAKYELQRKEQQVRSLKKEETRLEQRLADLRRGPAFLRDITELNRKYLEHRNTHPASTEEYGASCLPALLLETRCMLGAEEQLRDINNRLAKRQQTGE